MALLNAEVAGQSAAPADSSHCRTGRRQQGRIGLPADHRGVVAVRLDNQLDAAEVRWRPVWRTTYELGQREDPGGDLSDPRILRQELGGITTPHREAGGFQTYYRCSCSDDWMQDLQRGPQLPSSTVELTGANPGQPTAGWSLQDLRRVTGRGQHRSGCCNGLPGKEVGERVHPHNNRIPVGFWSRNPSPCRN